MLIQRARSSSVAPLGHFGSEHRHRLDGTAGAHLTTCSFPARWADELRRRLPDLPVVLTSGYSHVLAQEGSHGFELLHKPYAADELSRVLRQVIGHRGRVPQDSIR